MKEKEVRPGEVGTFEFIVQSNRKGIKNESFQLVIENVGWIVGGATSWTFRIFGNVPPEIWNRLGTKVLPKLRSGSDLKIGIHFAVTVDGQMAPSFENDLKQILEDLGLTGSVNIE